MKYILLILIFTNLVFCETYIISGGKENVVHIVSSNILKKAYIRAGLDMEPLFLPLEKSLQFSNSGKTDGELARIQKISKKYPNLLQIPVSIISVQATAFTKDKSIQIKNWSDLKKYKVMIVKGTKFIEKRTKDIPRKFAISFQEAFLKLNNNEVEVVVVPKLAGIKTIFDQNYKHIKRSSPPLITLKLYHFVHKKNAHLIPLLTPVLQKMKDSGEISYMRDAYLMSVTRQR